MPLATIARSLFLFLATVWGIANLVGLARLRESPSLRKMRFLAALNGLLMALSLVVLGYGQRAASLALGLAGLACGGLWLFLLFKHSLHNTTM